MGTQALEGAAQRNVAVDGKASRQDRLTVLEAPAFIILNEQMTNEEIRVTIAECVGWKFIAGEDESDRGWGKYPEEHSPFYRFAHQLPNYPEDLNAILPLLPRGINIYLEKDGEWYVGTMQEITPGTVNPSLALAACEFYLKWKGLWKE